MGHKIVSMKKNNVSASPVPPPKKKPPTVGLSFDVAIKALMGGAKIRRAEWGDVQEYCLLKDSFLMIHRNDKFHTWIVSEGDMLVTDWVIL